MDQGSLFDGNNDRKSARIAGHQAAEKAVRHAGEDWEEKAFDLLKMFAEPGQPFATIDLRKWAHKLMDLELPPDPRAWGAIMLRGKAEGIVRIYGKIHPKHTHGKAVSVWVKCYG